MKEIKNEEEPGKALGFYFKAESDHGSLELQFQEAYVGDGNSDRWNVLKTTPVPKEGMWLGY